MKEEERTTFSETGGGSEALWVYEQKMGTSC